MQTVAAEVAQSISNSGWAAQWSIILGAVGTLVTSGVAAYKSIKNGQKANQIADQTNGHLSKLREDLSDERAARVATEMELRTVYAVFSARLRMPVADLRQMIREEDTMVLPPLPQPKPRRPPPVPLPRRRRGDRFVKDRKEDPE